MKTEDANPASALYKIVDTNTVGLVGHSFGGVVGLFASQPPASDLCAFAPPFLAEFLTLLCQGPYTRPTELKAAVFYGTNVVIPNSPPPFPPFDLINLNTSGIDVALVQGTKDGLASPDKAQRTYDSSLEDPRGLITIKGANHYGICDENNPAGAIPDLTPGPTLAQNESLARVIWWTGWWLRAHLLNDFVGHFLICQASGSFDPVVNISTKGVCGR